VTRYLGIRDGHLVVGEKVKENLKIKSKTPIERLFKVFIEVINENMDLIFFRKIHPKC
jgi:hypothetical protein